MPDGRTVGYADFGPADGTPVIWCHGGPGSRLEPTQVDTEAAAAGYRLIGVDRPGYGLSTPWPERTIAAWVPDGLAVLDALGVERCIAVGMSTGGAYSFALAAAAPERITGVIACCALDRHALARGSASRQQPDDDGHLGRARPRRRDRLRHRARRRGRGEDVPAARGRDAPTVPADLALFTDPAWLAGFAEAGAAMFAQGVWATSTIAAPMARVGLVRRRRGPRPDDRAARSRRLDRRRRPGRAHRVARTRRTLEDRRRRRPPEHRAEGSPRRSPSCEARRVGDLRRWLEVSTRTGGTVSDSLAVTTSSGIAISLA